MPFSPPTLQVLLCIAGVACCVAMSMPQVHIVAYCGDLGYGVARGAEMLSLMLGFGIISRVASGFIADRIGGVRTLLLGSVLQGAALFLYLLFDGLMSLYVISALFGLFQGGIVPSYAIIVREYFSPREAGTRVGLVLMATLLGMALGGWLSGAIFDLTGSYRAAFLNGLGWNLVNVSIMTWLLLRSRGAASCDPADAPRTRRPAIPSSSPRPTGCGRACAAVSGSMRSMKKRAVTSLAFMRCARAVGFFGERGFGDPAPHVAERHQAEHVQVIGSPGAGIVGLGHGVLHEPHRGLLQMAERNAERRDERLHRRRRRSCP